MTRRQLRQTVLDALRQSQWLNGLGVRCFILDGTPEALEAYEGDLRSTAAGAVMLVGHVLRGKYVDSAAQGRKVARTCEIPVLLRINQSHASAPDPDDAVDEIIKMVSGPPVSRPGDKPVMYLSESLLQEQSPSIFSTTVTFVARVITTTV